MRTAREWWQDRHGPEAKELTPADFGLEDEDEMDNSRLNDIHENAAAFSRGGFNEVVRVNREQHARKRDDIRFVREREGLWWTKLGVWVAIVAAIIAAVLGYLTVASTLGW